MSLDGWRSFDMAAGLDLAMRSRVRLKAPHLFEVGRRGLVRNGVEDLALALVEWGEQAGDLVGSSAVAAHLEGRFGRTVFDDVPQLRVAVPPATARERERLGREPKGFGDLVLRHLDLGRELGERGGPAELELETGAGLLQPGQRVAGMNRQPDRRPVFSMPR